MEPVHHQTDPSDCRMRLGVSAAAETPAGVAVQLQSELGTDEVCGGVLVQAEGELCEEWMQKGQEVLGGVDPKHCLSIEIIPDEKLMLFENLV